MTKNDYINALRRELKHLGVAEPEDIAEEYERHFEFKSMDGCTEEEIAARLGDPAELARQFAQPQAATGSGALTAVGLAFAWVFASMIFVLLAAWALVMAAFALACALCAVCLALGLNVGGLIPEMPYLCAAAYAAAFAALAVLTAAGTVYCAAFVCQLARAWARVSHNARAASLGQTALPPLPAAPRFSPAASRALRRTALVSLIVFAAAFVLSAVLSMLLSGSVEFWHAWRWFAA